MGKAPASGGGADLTWIGPVVVYACFALIAAAVAAQALPPQLARLGRAIDAQAWPEIPGTVIAATGDPDAPGVLYRYRIGTRTFVSGKIELTDNCRPSAEALDTAGGLAVGDEVTVVVNPDAPAVAVLRRPRVEVPGLLAILFVCAFTLLVIIGLGVGLAGNLRRRRAATPPPVSDRPAVLTEVAPDFDGRALRDGGEPPMLVDESNLKTAGCCGTGCAIIAVAGFSGIVAAASDKLAADTPGALVAVAAVGLVAASALAVWIHGVWSRLTLPRMPELRLARPTVRLGEPIDLRWDFGGPAEAIDRLTISIVGVEQVVGGESRSEREFFRARVERTGIGHIRAGETAVVLPPDLPPDWESAGYRVFWRFALRGHSRRGPDMRATYSRLSVHPPKRAGEPMDPLIESAPGPDDDAVGITLAEPAARPGEPIRGTAAWKLDTAPKAVELRLAVAASVGDSRKPRAGNVPPICLPIPQPRATDRRRFILPAPDGAYSLIGRYGRLD
jgi:hypothetical protein